MDLSKIEQDLISEIKLTIIQARVYLLVTCYGKMTADEISKKLVISFDDAKRTAVDLMNYGAFIDITKTEYESMHPRFTAVNMYRRMCQRENIEFKRNSVVDNIGIVLEKPFDDARTK